MELKFIRKVAGIYVAPVNTQRELVLHRAAGFGWRLSIRDQGTKGFGTDLRCTRPTLPALQDEARSFAGSLITR